MPTTHESTSEAAIFGRVLNADPAPLPVSVAQAILAFGFDEADRERMRVLALKAKAGTLTPKEQEAIDNYEKVGHMLSLLKSKARRSLRSNGANVD